jgi:hypothetical protein
VCDFEIMWYNTKLADESWFVTVSGKHPDTRHSVRIATNATSNKLTGETCTLVQSHAHDRTVLHISVAASR